MASVSTDGKGNRRIKFYDAAGKQQGIRLGKADKKTAEQLCGDVEELLSAKQLGLPIYPATASRLGRLSDRLRRRFVQAGLLGPSEPIARQTGLRAFVEGYIASRTDVKASTKNNNYKHAKIVLLEYFGADRLLDSITPGDAEEFRIWLQTQRERRHGGKYSVNTVRRLCGRAKEFFNHAVKKRLIDESPFAGLKGLQVRGNHERRRQIPHEWIDRVLEACPNGDWRTLIVLCRYGGLRVSEACNLRWEHVDWKMGEIRVRCEKTERHEGRAWRVIPMFPEIRPYLEASWECAEDRAQWVIAGYRSSRNLRTQFARIVKHAGLEMWPKPFHNLRATRETELTGIYPEHVVCSWIGNTSKVAREHYLTVTQADLQRAIQNPTRPEAPAAGDGVGRGPKSGPAPAAPSGRQRNGAKSASAADGENAEPDAEFRSSASGAAPADGGANSPSRIRTYNLAVNSRSLYR
jgi:integrase